MPETLKEFWSDIGNVERAEPENIQSDVLAYLDKIEQQKRLLEHAARIIDSGMGAGILRYDPVQWFMYYHKSK